MKTKCQQHCYLFQDIRSFSYLLIYPVEKNIEEWKNIEKKTLTTNNEDMEMTKTWKHEEREGQLRKKHSVKPVINLFKLTQTQQYHHQHHQTQHIYPVL